MGAWAGTGTRAACSSCLQVPSCRSAALGFGHHHGCSPHSHASRFPLVPFPAPLMLATRASAQHLRRWSSGHQKLEHDQAGFRAAGHPAPRYVPVFVCHSRLGRLKRLERLNRAVRRCGRLCVAATCAMLPTEREMGNKRAGLAPCFRFVFLSNRRGWFSEASQLQLW